VNARRCCSGRVARPGKVLFSKSYELANEKFFGYGAGSFDNFNPLIFGID